MINCFHLSQNGRMEILNNLGDAFQCIEKGKFVWIDFDKPEEKDLSLLISKLNIHPLSIEDCLDQQTIPKMDVFPDYSFFVFNQYLLENDALCIREVNFIFGKGFLISIHGRDHENDGLVNKFRERIALNGLNCYKSPDYLLYALMDYIVDSKMTVIDKFENDVEALEMLVHEKPEKLQPQALLVIRKNLNELRKSLFYEREVLTKICRADSSIITEKSAIFYFKDIFDNLTRYFEEIEKGRETINNLFSLHLSAKNNQISMISLQMNEVMKRLTVITTIFMPLTFFSGVGGMSEWSMICGPENWKYSYPIFLFLMIVFAFIVYRILQKLKWA